MNFEKYDRKILDYFVQCDIYIYIYLYEFNRSNLEVPHITFFHNPLAKHQSCDSLNNKKGVQCHGLYLISIGDFNNNENVEDKVNDLWKYLLVISVLFLNVVYLRIPYSMLIHRKHKKTEAFCLSFKELNAAFTILFNFLV